MTAGIAIPFVGKGLEKPIPRDRWGRPLVLPPGGDRPIAYTRASSLGNVLDDGKGLTDWSCAMALRGAALEDRPEGGDGSIMRAARSLPEWDDDSRQSWREIVKLALTKGGADRKKLEGTTLHKLTEYIDTGIALPDGLDRVTLQTLEAYRSITAGLHTQLAEQFVVNDELQVAGTFDRLAHVDLSATHLPEWLRGRTPIVDLKTGNVEHSIGKFAIQLSIYARGKFYDPETHERHDTGADPHVGLLVHLPLEGNGRAGLYAINLDAGYEAAKLAAAAHLWNKRARPSNSRFTSDVVTQVASIGGTQ